MYEQLFPRGIEAYLAGGLCIGLGVALLYVATGRPGGISTFYSAAWSWLLDTPFFRQASLIDGRRWRLIYALGLLLGGLAYARLGLPVEASALPAWKLALGGVLIGFGARLGGGCTSGHGICGIASLSGGSLAMVCTFLATAIATAWAVTALGV
ncbi:MAG: YeeE/YedE thiosulfate transporter family protein [Dechloromonas sp.]|nr:YeeE/YedE thiosulfate transporter family protein [Dechloromonas sp.]